MLRPLLNWFTAGGMLIHRDPAACAGADGRAGRAGRAPIEVILLRCLGVGYLLLFVISTSTTHPQPGLHGRGLVILIVMVGFVAAALGTQPRNAHSPPWQRIALLLAVTAASAVLVILQPNGIWPAGAYFVGVVAALRLERLAGALTLGFSLAVLVGVSAAEGDGGTAVTVLVGVVPWFLVMRLMREARERHVQLEVAQVAEARAAAVAERGRLAREMHDVLAHSLSALALQLESTRLLAREQRVAQDVTHAIDQAHHLAVLGLEEARRAIAAARGDELPGPERLGGLAEAFGAQSGLAIAVQVNGEPHELAPDARLAVYRTAQEALTNVRRHATPERVEVRLDYRPEATVLVVEDHSIPGAPAPHALDSGDGYGLTGMRERAELLGGRLLAEPTAAGFRVELWLPAVPADATGVGGRDRG